MTNSKLSAVLLLTAAFVLGALAGGAALALADRGHDRPRPRGERMASNSPRSSGPVWS